MHTRNRVFWLLVSNSQFNENGTHDCSRRCCSFIVRFQKERPTYGSGSKTLIAGPKRGRFPLKFWFPPWCQDSSPWITSRQRCAIGWCWVTLCRWARWAPGRAAVLDGPQSLSITHVQGKKDTKNTLLLRWCQCLCFHYI